MTTEERLRSAALWVMRHRPDLPLFNGEYLHELLARAADEMDQRTAMFAQLALEQNKPETRISEQASEQPADGRLTDYEQYRKLLKLDG